MRPIPSFAFALAAAACHHAEDVEGPPPPPNAACLGDGTFPDRFHFLAFGSEVFRQGATIAIMPSADRSPAGIREVPMECTSGWTVAGPATLAPDRRAIVIAPDAPPGAEIRIAYMSGSERVGRTFRVVGRDAVVLTGRRRQTSIEGCTLPPVGELELGPDDRFSVTFQPFETYKDYWGSYTFDPASGRLVMTVDGGNFTPPSLDLDGAARIADGRLVLENVHLGSRDGIPVPAAGCRYTF